MKTEIFRSKNQLAAAFGNYLVKLAEGKSFVNIALSGGNTPETVFDVLANEYKNDIAWERIRFFWTDERCVAPDDAESNYKMAREHLLDNVPVSGKNVFRVKGELPPKKALEEYIKIIDIKIPKENGIPFFDLIILGIGKDGHTASIFPYQIHLWESKKWCEIGTHPESGQKRVTLTGQVINNSGQIVFIVTGKQKAAIVDEVLNREKKFYEYPASLVDRKKSLWMLDQQAAGKQSS